MKRNRKYRMPAGIATMLSLAFFMLSCAEDRENPPAQTPHANERTVTFTVKVPGGGGAPKTYALDETDENEVSTIAILLFDNGKYTYQPIYGSSIVADPLDSRNKTFTVSLPQGRFDMAVLANANPSLTAALGSISAGDAKADVLAQITLANSGKWKTNNADAGYNPIPMWGEIEDITVDDQLTGSQPVTLARMLAKIDVTLTTAPAKAAFDLKSVRLYNYNDKGLVAPDATNWNATNSVATAPSVPGTAQKPVNPVNSPLVYNGAAITQDASTPTTRGIACSNEIYTFEAAAGKANALATNTCLVIGGRYTGEPQDSYYRIDLANTTGSTTTFLALLRNHRYRVNIADISGPGLNTPDAAFNSAPVNITATITGWNDSGMTDIDAGNNYFGVSQGEFVLTADSHTTASTDNRLYVKTDVAAGWSVAKIVDGLNGPINWLSLQPASGAAGANVPTSLVAMANPSNSVPRVAFVHLKSDNLTYVVKVTQNYRTTSTVSLDQNPAGIGTSLTGAGTHNVGSTITVSVTGNSCYDFAGWWNGATKVSGNLSFQYTVTGDNVTLTAKWTIKRPQISLVNNVETDGTIKVNGAASPQNVDCGSTATLTATDGTNYSFAGWYNQSGNTLQSTNRTWTTPAINGAITYMAKWNSNLFRFTLDVKPASAGSVSGLTGSYSFGSTQTLPAPVANPGYVLDGWYKDDAGQKLNGATPSVSVESVNKYTARFLANSYTISLKADPASYGTLSLPGGPYEFGSTVTLPNAVDKPGYVFDAWYNDETGAPLVGRSPTIVIGTQNAYTARFKLMYRVYLGTKRGSLPAGLTVDGQPVPVLVPAGATVRVQSTGGAIPYDRMLTINSDTRIDLYAPKYQLILDFIGNGTMSWDDCASLTKNKVTIPDPWPTNDVFYTQYGLGPYNWINYDYNSYSTDRPVFQMWGQQHYTNTGSGPQYSGYKIGYTSRTNKMRCIQAIRIVER